jgi:isopenicillin N synthase-like dioxygenase
MRLLAVIAANLGARSDQLAQGFDTTHTSFLRLNHYPAHPRTDSNGAAPLGVGEHTDSGALTLLLQDDQPGLEVRRHGRWHLVQPLDGALVVNIGDIVQVWSNDRYAAALHRVISTRHATATAWRSSSTRRTTPPMNRSLAR